MDKPKSDIIACLQKEILALQGILPLKGQIQGKAATDKLFHTCPGQQFPRIGVHEWLADTKEEESVTIGFVVALLSSFLKADGMIAWVSIRQKIFPPALQQFGIPPDKVLFIDVPNKKELRWVTEEVIRCEALTAVISEWSEINFIESRRLQLAVEKSHVTTCLLRNRPKYLTTTASTSRWQIKTHASSVYEGLPGIGLPRWQVNLLKMRNGTPGRWLVEWDGEHWHIIDDKKMENNTWIKKTG